MNYFTIFVLFLLCFSLSHQLDLKLDGTIEIYADTLINEPGEYTFHIGSTFTNNNDNFLVSSIDSVKINNSPSPATLSPYNKTTNQFAITFSIEKDKTYTVNSYHAKDSTYNQDLYVYPSGKEPIIKAGDFEAPSFRNPLVVNAQGKINITFTFSIPVSQKENTIRIYDKILYCTAEETYSLNCEYLDTSHYPYPQVKVKHNGVFYPLGRINLDYYTMSETKGIPFTSNTNELMVIERSKGNELNNSYIKSESKISSFDII